MAARQDREPFELFLIHEARLLDERRFREWMELFTDDGTYWVPAVPNQSSPFDQASLFYDDRDLMKTRIDRLEHPRIHIQTPPSRTAHIIGNVTVVASAPAPERQSKDASAPAPERQSKDSSALAPERQGKSADEFKVSSTVLMAEYRDEQQRLFAGRQTHKLRREGESFRIVQKKVELINCDSAFEAMAVPI